MGAVEIFAFSFLLFLCVPLNHGMPSEPSAKPELDLSTLLSNKFIRCSHKCRQDLNCLGITIFQSFANSTVETEDDIFWCRFDLQRRPEDLAKGSVVYQVMQRDKLVRAQGKPVNGRGKRSVRRKSKSGKLNGSSKRLSPREEVDGQASTLRHVPIIRPGPSSQISEILVPNVPQPTLQVQVPVLKPTQPQATAQTSSELFQSIHPMASTLGTSQAPVSTIPALNLPVATNFVAGPGQQTQQKILTAAIPGQPQATTQILLNAVPLTSPPQQIIPSGALPSAQLPVVGTSEPSIDVRTGLNELTNNASLTPTNDSSVTVAVQNASMTKLPGQISQDFKLPTNASHLQLQLPSVTFDFSNTSSAEINVTTTASVKTKDQNPSVTSNKITASINPAEVKVHLVDTTPTEVLATLRPQSLSTTEVPLEPSNETTVSREDLNVNTTEKGPVDIDFESPTGVNNASEAEGRNPVGARPTVQGLPTTTVAPQLATSVASVNATSTHVPKEEATSTIASVNITAGPTTTSKPQNVSAEDKTFGSSSTSTPFPELVTSSTSAPTLVTTALPSTTSKPTEPFTTEKTKVESTTMLPTTTDLTSTVAEESTTVLPMNATEATTTETSEFLEESTNSSSGTSTVTEGSTTVVPETTTEAGTTTTEFVSAETSTIPTETSTILPETTTVPRATETTTLIESTTTEPATTTEAMPNQTSIPLTTSSMPPPATTIVVSQNTSLLKPQDSSTVAKVNVTITPTSNVSHIRIEPVVRVEVFNYPANLTNTDLDTESGDIQTRITKVSKLVNITFNSLTSLLNALSGRPSPDALAHNDPFLQKPPPVKEQLEGPHATENINTEIPLPDETTTEFPILSSTEHHELVTLPEGSLRLDISPPVTTTTTPPGNLSKHDNSGITETRLGLVDSSDSRPPSHFTTGGVAAANNSDAQRRSGTEPGVISIGSISSGNLTSSNLTASTDNKPEAPIRTESKLELPTSPTVAFVTNKLGLGNASSEGSTASLPSASSTSASGVVPPSPLQIPNSTLSPPLVPSISMPPTSKSNPVVLLPQVSETQAVGAAEVSSMLVPGVLVPVVPTILSLVSAATTSLPPRATAKPSVPDPQVGSSEKDRLLSLMRVKIAATKSRENSTDTSSPINSTLSPSLIATIASPAVIASVPSLFTPTASQLTNVSPSAEIKSHPISATMSSPTENATSLPIRADQQPGDSTMVPPPSVQKRVSVDDACVSEDAERFKRGVTATAFSVISGVPTLLSFVNGSNCIGTFSKNGWNGLRSLSSLFPGSFFAQQPRLISASFFFNNSLYLFDSGKEQTVARFVFDDKNGSFRQDEEYGCVSTDRFLQEVCGVNSPPPFAIKAVAQVSQNDSSCVVFDKSGKLLISPRATEDARLLAKGLIALLDEELFLYIESVHTWLDEPDPEKVYVFGSDQEVYEIVKDASAFKWAQGSYRVLPYDSLLQR